MALCRDFFSPYPHMIPKQDFFVQLMRALNLRKSNDIVLYEQGYGWYAERTAFVFRAFGHKNVRVLDGQLKKWTAEGRPTESHAEVANEDDFNYEHNGDAEMGFEEIVKARDDGSVQHIDIRPAAMLTSIGKIPGTINMQTVDFYADDGRLKSKEDLAKMF